MSQITDIMGRLEGDLIALQGFMGKFAPPSPAASAPNTTFEQQQAAVQPAPAKPTKTDYEYVKKLLDEVQALAKSASDEVDKAMKIPPPPEPEASHSSTKSKG